MSDKKHKAGKVPDNTLQVPVQADAPVTGPPVKAFRTDDQSCATAAADRPGNGI